MTQVLEVTTTAPTQAAALRLAESAIAAGLAAGGQVSGPVVAIFSQHGELGRGERWTVSFTTTASRYRELESHLLARGEWPDPEITAVPVVHAPASYTEWVRRVTSPKVPAGARVSVSGEAADDGFEPL